MNEDFLSYAWKFGLFQRNGLRTDAGESIELLSPGALNNHSGPDFFQARVRIGGTLWAGNVELHIRASDWARHNHQTDPAYNNVILHVVYDNDAAAVNQLGKTVPTLALKGRLYDHVYQNYLQFLKSKTWIPCENRLKEVDELTTRGWLDRLVVARLERKSSEVLQLLENNKQDWAATFHAFLCRYFGFKVNADPMERLARQLPLRVINKHRDNPLQLEALFLGQAGLLPENGEETYTQQLKREYKHLKAKFELSPMEASMWKFMRMRPTNFPTVRLAQLAALMHKQHGLFAQLIEARSLEEFRALFKVTASTYWDTHYHFGKEGRQQKKSLGQNSIDLLLINTVVVFLFVYGRAKGLPVYEDRAISLLEKLDPEPIGAMKKWKERGLSPQSAMDTQALLELKANYCNQKKCLICNIGTKLLRT